MTKSCPYSQSPKFKGIERDTTYQAVQPSITVFAKLPRVNIPTPLGNDNSDALVRYRCD